LQIPSAAIDLNPAFADYLAQAQARAETENARGYAASGIAWWKRAHFRRYFGQGIKFASAEQAAELATQTGAKHLHWATKPLLVPRDGVLLIEDGFLRSHGLGLRLLPPVSMVIDDLGIHYYPVRESRLEQMIAKAPQGSPRALALFAQITTARLSKYNTGQPQSFDIPKGHRILVAGQVEDDASILCGATGPIRTNLALLEAARAAHPNAVILWKPHPDVEAGYRKGAVPLTDVARLGAATLSHVSAARAIDLADEVWTMTSLIGFEALLRGKPVTCGGLPFYAGWGLTTDLVAPPQRRMARPDVAALAHAALIDYPRYWDPLTGTPTAPEIAIARLAEGITPKRGPLARLLAIGRRRT